MIDIDNLYDTVIESVQVQKSNYFSGHYCLEHSKQFSDKCHSVITSSCCLSIVYKLS